MVEGPEICGTNTVPRGQWEAERDHGDLQHAEIKRLRRRVAYLEGWRDAILGESPGLWRLDGTQGLYELGWVAAQLKPSAS